MKYKVGDCVLVRNDLVPGEYYGCDVFISEMKNYLGRIACIRCLHPYMEEYGIVGSSWWWTDKMFVCKIPFSDNLVVE